MTIDGVDRRSDRQLTGVMILHGFTANLESVRTLFEPVAKTGLKLITPLLRGHGEQSPEELRGVTWQDWFSDAESALMDAAGNHGKVIVIGHSMGALLTLQLAARHPELVDSIVLATPALRLASLLAPDRPLNFLAPLLSMLIDRWEFEPCFADPENAIIPRQYSWAPTRTILSMFDLVHSTRSILSRVSTPVLIIHGRNERIVLPESADIVLREISTPQSEKSVFWFDKTDHQIFCDCERDAAVSAVMDYVSRRIDVSTLSIPA
ncbi:MAG: alpha/beta fold hydrolase [Chlorobiaceae bacterium]|nr:alpha/beta fold hydrolase [Chlorobiales bacterium]NTU90384.1 alpha/beta fold hydrolase [Chlorobiaceae bacterium]